MRKNLEAKVKVFAVADSLRYCYTLHTVYKMERRQQLDVTGNEIAIKPKYPRIACKHALQQ